MRTSIAAFAAGAVLLQGGGVAAAADELTLQLKWVTQAQFAGYYVAKDRGFYEETGLDVTILPGGPEIAPPQVIADGGADVIVEWMPAPLAAREGGVPLLNIAQVFDRSGMMLTCRKGTGIEQPADFPGHTLGVWFAGNEYPFLSWMSQLGIPTAGGEDGVTVLQQGFDVEPLLQGRADCISTMTYNEYWQLIDAGLAPEDLVVFLYEDQGVATLEDGLYVLESSLEDEATTGRLARFLEASIRGWEYAALHPDEAAAIVLEHDESGAQTQEHQRRMMGAVNELVGGAQGIGFLDPADYQRTVDVLLAGGSDPVITATPEGAWTHDVWEAIQ